MMGLAVLKSSVRAFLTRVPLVGPPLASLGSSLFPGRRVAFVNSSQFWEEWYAGGGNSGPGSYNEPGNFKAKFLNEFVREHDIRDVIEWGSGDGSQLIRANYKRYVGVDVSKTAVERCRQAFAGDKTKRFYLSGEEPETAGGAELALSLDVIYHLVENTIYHDYMVKLFASATRFVIIYAWDVDDDSPSDLGHVRHRAFTRWARENAAGWAITETLMGERPDFANFYVFEASH